MRRAKCPFFRLIFCQIFGHKWKFFNVKTYKISKKLPKTIANSCENFSGCGFNHFCATPIWNSLPRHMTYSVEMKNREGLTFIQSTNPLSTLEMDQFQNEKYRVVCLSSNPLILWLLYIWVSFQRKNKESFEFHPIN